MIGWVGGVSAAVSSSNYHIAETFANIDGLPLSRCNQLPRKADDDRPPETESDL